MPRTARKRSESGIYHIILRGINRQTIFNDDEDRKKFKDTLRRYKEVCEFYLYGYCFMGNHLHLLLSVGHEPLEQIMRRIGGSYVYWYNKKYDRIGNLFQDRFKSEPVESDAYLLTVLRYIHFNPVKAGMVKMPAGYKWSSFRDYLEGKGLADTEFILSIFSPNRSAAVAQYKEFMCQGNDDKCLEIVDGEMKVSDDGLKKIIQEKYKVSMHEFQNEPNEKMKAILREILLNDQITTRQLARVAGVSKGFIWRL